MRRNASDRLVLGAFVLLAASSLGLKAAAGPPRDGLVDLSSDRLERELSDRLREQSFKVSVRQFPHRSSLVIGVRGHCEVGARDAHEGVAHAILFDQDAAGIGPVRYFYRGKSYDDPPTFVMRVGRLETEAMSRLGLASREPVLIAFAATAACGSDDFKLSDVRV